MAVGLSGDGAGGGASDGAGGGASDGAEEVGGLEDGGEVRFLGLVVCR